MCIYLRRLTAKWFSGNARWKTFSDYLKIFSHIDDSAYFSWRLMSVSKLIIKIFENIFIAIIVINNMWFNLCKKRVFVFCNLLYYLFINYLVSFFKKFSLTLVILFTCLLFFFLFFSIKAAVRDVVVLFIISIIKKFTETT